jgi:hypothetical protein
LVRRPRSPELVFQCCRSVVDAKKDGTEALVVPMVGKTKLLWWFPLSGETNRCPAEVWGPGLDVSAGEFRGLLPGGIRG